MDTRELSVHFRFEDNSFWATVEEFPGVFAAGDTIEELSESLAEGIALMLADDECGTPTVHLSELRPRSFETVASAELVCA